MKKFIFEFKKVCLEIKINFPILLIFLIFSLGFLGVIFTDKYLLENNEGKQKLLMRKDIVPFLLKISFDLTSGGE
jgi:hypothetical protein